MLLLIGPQARLAEGKGGSLLCLRSEHSAVWRESSRQRVHLKQQVCSRTRRTGASQPIRGAGAQRGSSCSLCGRKGLRFLV